MKRPLVVLIITTAAAILMLTACDFITNPPEIGSPRPAEQSGEPTPDVGQPDGVAQSFLDAWEQGNYEAMYSFLSPNSQAEYRLEEFTETYTRTANTIVQVGLETSLLSVLKAPTGNTAQAAFRVTYESSILGPIEEELNMQLVNTGDRWGIVWTPALIFPELAGGNTLQLSVERPARANIYDRNGLWLVSSGATTYTLTIVPGEIGEGYEEDMLNLLSQVLRMTPEQIRQQYAGAPADWRVALGDVDAEILMQYSKELESYPPIGWMEKSGRRYFNVLAP
ncbi:MAG TPA: NTF2-like N-terminal transpeptidase domain-containing protein, partial [Aggregatilineales bacterium]|nr:NTF2-like N-terminal transpeptidase domain-containing protein [Aggregatilineales bacterium]